MAYSNNNCTKDETKVTDLSYICNITFHNFIQMNESIITGQYVRIEQTPASVGERLLALCIDYMLEALCIIGVLKLAELVNSSDAEFISIIVCLVIVFFYSLLCEIFNNGQTVGKHVMHLRVVKVDGSEPTIGSYLLRWILSPIDISFGGGIGLIVILVSKNRQRIGDIAGGTMVIKEQNYRHLHVSLDEFEHLSTNYQPVYPQAADLSLEQVNVIVRTLSIQSKDRPTRIQQLSQKVIQTLQLPSSATPNEKLLETLLRDYQHYALEEI